MSATNLNPAELLPHQGRKPSTEYGSETRTSESRAEEHRGNLYQRGKDAAVQAEQKFENYVSAHPVKSVLIAAGVGMAVGLLLGRRR